MGPEAAKAVPVRRDEPTEMQQRPVVRQTKLAAKDHRHIVTAKPTTARLPIKLTQAQLDMRKLRRHNAGLERSNTDNRVEGGVVLYKDVGAAQDTIDLVAAQARKQLTPAQLDLQNIRKHNAAVAATPGPVQRAHEIVDLTTPQAKEATTQALPQAPRSNDSLPSAGSLVRAVIAAPGRTEDTTATNHGGLDVLHAARRPAASIVRTRVRFDDNGDARPMAREVAQATPQRQSLHRADTTASLGHAAHEPRSIARTAGTPLRQSASTITSPAHALLQARHPDETVGILRHSQAKNPPKGIIPVDKRRKATRVSVDLDTDTWRCPTCSKILTGPVLQMHLAHCDSHQDRIEHPVWRARCRHAETLGLPISAEQSKDDVQM